MEYAYSILMFCFTGGILLYAGLLALGETGLIMRSTQIPKKNLKAYARQLAKVLAITSIAPLFSGLVALIISPDRMPLLPPVTLIGAFVVCMRIGVRLMRDFM